MKPRARRITIAAAVFGTGVVAVLVVTHWDTVRDHVVAWSFQLTRETATILPNPAVKETPGFQILAAGGDDFATFDWKGCLLVLATHSDQTVIFDPAEDLGSQLRPDPEGGGDASIPPTAAPLLGVLKVNGYRVLEQRFPRRAYVVIRDPSTGLDGGAADHEDSPRAVRGS